MYGFEALDPLLRLFVPCLFTGTTAERRSAVRAEETVFSA